MGFTYKSVISYFFGAEIENNMSKVRPREHWTKEKAEIESNQICIRHRKLN